MNEAAWKKKQKDAVILLNTIVRSSELNGKVELQQLLIAFSQILGRAYPSAHFELQPLYAYMKENCQAQPRVIDNLLIFLEFRLGDIGIKSTIPKHLQFFTQEQKNAILAEWQGGNTTSFEREKTPAPGVAAAPPTKIDDSKHKKKKSENGKHRVAKLVAIVVLGIGAVVGLQIAESKNSNAPPVLKELEIKPAEDGFRCLTLLGAPPNIMCTISDKEWKSYSKSERALRAERTLSPLKSKNYKIIRVQTKEDGRIVLRME
ncbi:MAG: hypothetical protein GY822_05330 [Deltaproteobacteria bacterium]|nr:hypothetical protein [Deltaproteobacteria bacterium]